MDTEQSAAVLSSYFATDVAIHENHSAAPFSVLPLQVLEQIAGAQKRAN